MSIRMKLSAAPVVLLLCALIGAGASSAADLYVPAQYSTVRAAVAAAVDGDTVHVAEGTYREEEGMTISSSITIAGETSGAMPRIEIDEQSPDVGSDGIIVAADDVTFQNIHFYRASHSSYHAVIAVPKGGPWPDYVVEYEGLSLLGCTIEGGRYGAYLHVEDLVVDGCTFYDTYRDSLILAAVRGTTTIKNNNFIGEAYSGKKAILVEGGVEQPYVAGSIHVESNTCTGKHNFFLYNHWGNVADTVALTIKHNSIDTIGSSAVTLYPAYVTDPGAFQKFSSILVQDNIVSNGGRAVYIDYDSYGSVGGSLKPVPATGQVVVRNTLSYANSGDASDTTDPTGNFGFSDTVAETPPGASMAIFDLAGNLTGDPLYDDPSHMNGDFVLQPGSPGLGAAWEGTNIGEWQGTYQASPTPTATPSPISTSTPTATPTTTPTPTLPPTVTPTPTPTTTPVQTTTPLAGAVRINFQPAPPCPVPESYTEDHGEGYGIKGGGRQYGWR